MEDDRSPCQPEEHEDEVEFPLPGAVSKILKAVTKPFKNLTGSESTLVWDDSDEYDFTHTHRGMLILFNNEFFEVHTSRPGSTLDAENIEKTFSKLGFTVYRHDNKTRDEMFRILKKAAKTDHSSSDCFACVVLSHGDEVHLIDKKVPGVREREDLVYATDQIILTKEIVELFVDKKCPSLQGKPRLFFIQACRGGKLDDGVNVGVLGLDEFDAKPTNIVEVRPCPIYKDFLMANATPPGYYAFRRPDAGSWFIKALCAVFAEPNIEKVTLTKLLTLVQKLVSQEFESMSSKVHISGKKQTPCFSSMLVKDVYFRKQKDDSTDQK